MCDGGNLRDITCIVCPVGCKLTVELDGTEILSVEGNLCPRGIEYGKSECLNPVRVLTTTIRVQGHEWASVKSDAPLPKDILVDVKLAIDKITLTAPVNVGDVVISNVCGTNVNIIATKNI